MKYINVENPDWPVLQYTDIMTIWEKNMAISILREIYPNWILIPPEEWQRLMQVVHISSKNEEL